MCLTSSCIANASLQEKADKLREGGSSLEAINVYNHLIVNLQKEHKDLEMVPALTGRLLSWKHLFYETDARIYAIMVEKQAEAISEIVPKERKFLAHYLLGTAATLLDKQKKAEVEFSRALQLYPNDSSERGDWMTHLGDAMYRNGKKKLGKKTILEGIGVIQLNSDHRDDFLINVWLSGAYLRLAKLLKSDSPQESAKYLEQAREIIENDERLVIRKKQLEMF